MGEGKCENRSVIIGIVTRIDLLNLITSRSGTTPRPSVSDAS